MDLIWMCPVCTKPLRRNGRKLECAASHAFDVAREGYVNLLLAHQKKSPDAGDSADAARARRSFLAQGHYDCLSDRINEILASELAHHDAQTRCVLDAGCGEGYFLRRHAEQMADEPRAACHRYGVDISKPSIRLAARVDRHAEFAVGSTYRLPVRPASVDIACRIFAPSDDAEMLRVLRRTGRLLIVSPGPDHLQALRRMLYDTPREHVPEPQSPEGFRRIGNWRVTYGIRLISSEPIRDLVAMTPYQWRGDRSMREQLLALDSLDVEADFLVNLYALE